MTTFFPSRDNVKLLGRAFMRDDRIWLAYSGSGIDFKINGSKVIVNLTGDSTAEDEEKVNDRAKVEVYVDGERKLASLIDSSEKKLTVKMPSGEHVVRVIKITESAMSFCIIESLETDSETVEKVADRDLYIEIIGDSITCGYGVDQPDPDINFITDTEDVTKSYSYLTASNLGADYGIASLSGYGIISGYTDNPANQRPDQIMPEHYEEAGFSFANIDGKQPQDIPWDFSGRARDIVVINLGTNDDSFCDTNKYKQLWYKDEYKKFLCKVRTLNPDAYIFCILGMMGARLYPYVEMAVSEYADETGDKKICAVEMAEQNREIDGIAADYHPSPATHKKAASYLSDYIQKTLNI